MSLPPGKLHLRPGRAAGVRVRRADAGIARGPGLAVAGVTAAIVFVIGQQLFPIKPREAPLPPAAPVAPAPPPVAPPADDAGAVTATNVADAGGAAAEADASRAVTAEKADKKDDAADETATPEKAVAEEAPTTPTGPKVNDKRRQADRELAREAWRRNRPDISVLGTKTSVLVPIRGSIKGADFKILKKTRTVVVTLPKAVSMITLPVYNLKHPSFKKLWIDQNEANAQPKDGSKLRLVLSETFDPQVEITEDFVRITIRRPTRAGDETPAEKRRGSRAEKHARPEKSDEAADEAPAPAPEKSSEKSSD